MRLQHLASSMGSKQKVKFQLKNRFARLSFEEKASSLIVEEHLQ